MTDPVDQFADTRDMEATYRCVCGESFPLPKESGSCPVCGRHYDADVLRDAAADTALLPGSTGDSSFPRRDEGPDQYVGKKLEHFQIINRIGGGGMGAVYRALDESLQRYVALKVIRPSENGDHSEVQQIFQEARAQARVNHPHVAHIYYVSTDHETPFLAMELVGTHTLAQRLKYGPLPFPDVARYALQVAQALEHAAKFDIVHGDVKPSNILLVDHRTVKLTDFGLARRHSELSGDPGQTAGTPNYISPEAARGNPTDHRSDMYALGVTLFEMTFGRLPYTRHTGDLQELLLLHRSAPPEFPEPWPAELPEGWRDVLVRLLAKDPAERYQDFAELITDLQKLQPVELPNARPLLRGMAWIIDLIIFGLPIAVLRGTLESYNNPSLWLLGTLGALGIVFGLSYLQAKYGTTPGKKLLQVRIVDDHGLRPARATLGLRAVLQFLGIWKGLADFYLMHNRQFENLSTAIDIVIGVFVLVEMGFVLFAKGNSIHDRIFGTRVVLDAAAQ